jgi:hypothetical protein
MFLAMHRVALILAIWISGLAAALAQQAHVSPVGLISPKGRGSLAWL